MFCVLLVININFSSFYHHLRGGKGTKTILNFHSFDDFWKYFYNTQYFLQNPALQERAFVALCSVNKWILRRDIKWFVGKKINGVTVTESGILAAAHLAGAGNVKKYLRTYGKYQFTDAFGTTIDSYIKKFGGYDVSFVVPNKYATV